VALVSAISGGIRSAGDTVPNVEQTRVSRKIARKHANGFKSCCSYAERN